MLCCSFRFLEIEAEQKWRRLSVSFHVWLWAKSFAQILRFFFLILSFQPLCFFSFLHHFVSPFPFLLRLSCRDFKQMFWSRHDDSYSAPLVSHEQIKATLQTPPVFPLFLLSHHISIYYVSLFSPTLFLPLVYSLCSLFFSSLLAKPWDCTVSILTFTATVGLSLSLLSLICEPFLHTPSLILYVHDFHPSGSGFSPVLYLYFSTWHPSLWENVWGYSHLVSTSFQSDPITSGQLDQ